ncbi:heterodisulfide reductase-related iron-sulfur binding cluster [uncultured Reyranella sp.]|uniref:heterodisulfide reductase-related iron-sulfur binding cluster n=1 Tax=uncultured Reyranella sp. TaxID=735512 RepID=UPI00259C9140|nr:heterodisulfide reductase-related iron-sulfur binding cluster [uncultured Reyranella sp.]
MQTNFTLAQLADPENARSEHILRKCVHCGFCTATCPTFVLLGDERDSPRGRIYLIKAMLEGDRAPTHQEVRHVDRCLSCLSCMTTCPSGVNYMHLVDHGRHRIEESYQRAPADRFMRGLLAWLMPRPAAFRWAMVLGRLAKPLAPLLPATSPDPGGATFLRRLRAMLEAVPDIVPSPSPVDRPQTFPATGLRRRRVALMPGCGQQVLAPEVNEATVRLLTRHDIEVVNVAGSGCCGSSVLHVGRNEQAIALAKANITAWLREIDGAGLDAIVINASGCGTTVKDYGNMLAAEPEWHEKALQVAKLAKDVSEVMLEIGLVNVEPKGLTVAYHAACSMQHGQKVIEPPKRLLRDAGFIVKDVPEGHLCCGWAGTYQVLQPELSRRLRDRKVANIESVKPDVIAAGNFGCIGNIAAGTGIPIAHTVELLDWATGGPKPAALG